MTTKTRPEALDIAEDLVLRLVEKYPIKKEDKRPSTYYVGEQQYNMPPVQDAEVVLEMILRAAGWLAGENEGISPDPPDLLGYLG